MAKTSKRKKAQQRVRAAQQLDRSKRATLKLLRNGAIGAAILGGGGVWAMRSVQAMALEHDLTRIGQGKPVVVQVHDPQCPTCTALQRQTRKAMRQFGECDLLYLVADVSQPDGAAFANRHGVPHVTLLLFDGEGQLRQTIRGMRYRDELETILAGHFERYASS